jgi:tetratricopeptide (TPR) repeat protein
MKASSGGWNRYWQSILVIAGLGFCTGNAAAVEPAARPTAPGVSAASLYHQDASVVSADELAIVALLPELQKPDQVADRLTRCINYPDPPNVIWPRNVVVSLCHHTFDKTLTLDQITEMLKDHHADLVESAFAAYKKAQRGGANPDLFDLAFSRAFSNSCKCARDAADAWLEQKPNSAFALVASGLQYASEAGDARGTRYANETSAENLAQMSALDVKAVAAFRKALTIDATLTPAIHEEVFIAMREGDRAAALAWLQKGLALYPDNYSIYSIYVMSAMPRWGGSVAELNRAKALALRESVHNPLLVIAAGEADVYLQECDGCKMHMRDFESTLVRAPMLSSLRQAGVLAVQGHNFPLGAVYLSELLRFSPGPELWARTNRGIAWTYTGQFDAAQRDDDSALAIKADYQPALELKRMIEGSRAEAKALAEQKNAIH